MLKFTFSFKVKSLYDFVFALFFFFFLGDRGVSFLFFTLFYMLEIYIYFNIKEDQNPIPDEMKVFL